MDNVAVTNYRTLTQAAANWEAMLDRLRDNGWDIEQDISGDELADTLIALVQAANAESQPDPLMRSLALAYAAFGLDEPPVEYRRIED